MNVSKKVKSENSGVTKGGNIPSRVLSKAVGLLCRERIKEYNIQRQFSTDYANHATDVSLQQIKENLVIIKCIQTQKFGPKFTQFPALY